MQHQANSVNTTSTASTPHPSLGVGIGAGGLSCGSPLTDFCRPRVCRPSMGAGAGLGNSCGTPRRFSSLWRAPEPKYRGKVLCIGPRILFRRQQPIGFVVQPKASRLVPASALASFNAKARHRGSQPVVQQAALAERHAQCTHNPSLNLTRYGRPAWSGWRHSVHFRQPGQAVLPQQSG